MTAQLLKKLTLVRVMNFQYQIHIVYSEFVLCAQNFIVSLERLLHLVEQFIFSGRFGYIIK